MPAIEPWKPGRMWEGQDAYVVGGGDSLRAFDWNRIAGANVVGCNSAFALGARVCPIVVFGDEEWWKHLGKPASGRHAKRELKPADPCPLCRAQPGERCVTLESYGGIVVGCSATLWSHVAHGWMQIPPWLLLMRRGDKGGLSTAPGELAWNGHTGSLGINLALALGARTVYLLGFDMKVGEGGKHNWHDLRYEPGSVGAYESFVTQSDMIATDLRKKFQGREIVNVNDGSHLFKLDKHGALSTEPLFPTVGVEQHFAGRKTPCSS